MISWKANRLKNDGTILDFMKIVEDLRKLKKYNISLIVPGIRVNNWERLFETAINSINPYDFEMIFVGPYDLPENLKNKENIKFFKDFGHPARCLMIGSTLAEGKYITWTSDDGFFLPNALAQCIELAENKNELKNDCIAIKYAEGTNFTGKCPPDSYFTAWYHGDLKLEGIPKHYKTAPVGFYNLEYFRELGGLDCSFEHANFNCLDLSFRVQNNGGQVYLSPSLVSNHDWSWIGNDAGPIQQAYFENDKQKMTEMWSQDQSKRLKINYWNWKDVDSKWARRFK